MRILSLASILSMTMAFSPSFKPHRPTTTRLEVSRRDILASGIAASYMVVTALAAPANAASSTTFFEPEKLFEPAQMKQGGKVDLNSAFVVSV